MPVLEIEIRAFGEGSEVGSAQAADLVAAAFTREHWNVALESGRVQEWRSGVVPNGVVRIKVEE